MHKRLIVMIQKLKKNIKIIGFIIKKKNFIYEFTADNML